jgi:CHAD domain-containing protein
MAALATTSRAAGLVLSPDDDAAVAARAVVRFHLRAFAAAEEEARAGQVEPVHQLRVATRRLRAALHLFASFAPKRFVESMQRELSWLATAIGPVRDLDVLTQAVQARAARLDPELRGALGPVGIAIHDRRAEALETLAATLRSSRCHRLLQRLSTFAEPPRAPRRSQPLGQAVPALATPLLRAVKRAGRQIVADSPPPELHRLRVRVKRLRYALEALRGLGIRSVRDLIARLERLQGVLGDTQDAATQVTWLRAYAAGDGVPAASLLAVGALLQALSRRVAKRRRRALRAWRKVEREGLLETVEADLARQAREQKVAHLEEESRP